MGISMVKAQVLDVLQRFGFPSEIQVERSGTHFHPSKEMEEACGGFTKMRELTTPNEYVAEEKAIIYLSLTQCIRCSILLPARNYAQVEMSITDQLAYKLTKIPTVTFSGQGSETTVAVSLPKRDEGISRHVTRYFENVPVIAAAPHIHVPEHLAKYRDEFLLLYSNKFRSGTIKLHAHRNPIPFPVIHLDNDEWNAANITAVDSLRLY
jgi:propanediol utilization protein